MMSMFDWDGDGKNTFADDYLEYQIYQETMKDSDEADSDFDEEPNIFGSDSERKEHTEDYHIPPMFREKKQPAKPAKNKKEEEKDKKSVGPAILSVAILFIGIFFQSVFENNWVKLLILVSTLVAFCVWIWYWYYK